MVKSSLVALATLISVNVLASDKVVLTKDNVIVMSEPFERETVAKVAQSARDLDALLSPGEPIFLLLDSPGGSIDAGIELINNLNSLDRPVHTITTFAASMGFQTAQSVNGKRYVLPHGTLMSHRARGQFSGEFPGQLDSRYQHYLRRVQTLEERAVERTKGKHTNKSYAELIRDEFWCDGQDCVNAGFADEVVLPTCGQSLQGTKSEKTLVEFMGSSIEIATITSKCPLITGVLEVKASVNGKTVRTAPGGRVIPDPTISIGVVEVLQNKINEIVNSHSDLINKVQLY